MVIQSVVQSPFQIMFSFDSIQNNPEKHGWNPSDQLKNKTQLLSQELAMLSARLDEHHFLEVINREAALIGEMFSGFYPAKLEHNGIKAISLPFHNVVFNHSLAFKNILQEAGPDFTLDITDSDAHHAYVANCCLILHRYYNCNLDFDKPVFLEIPNAKRISKFYKVLYNNDFTEITPTDRSLAITAEDIDLLIDNYEDIDLWKRLFPVGSWLLKGFSIMTLIDVTVENALSVFKEKFLALKSTNFKEHVTAIFKSVLDLADVRVGFTIYDPVSDRLRPAVFNQEMLSLLLPSGLENITRKVLCETSYTRLIEKHTYFAVADTTKLLLNDPKNALAKNFIGQQIRSFILTPVVKNGVVLGILETVSGQPRALNTITAQKLGVVLPFLADSIERLITRFHFQAEAVIQQYYTTIHPSVKWKFVHEAEKFLFHQELGQHYHLPELFLKNVHPLYGQIDIKGSTRKRNECIQADLTKQLRAVMHVCQQANTIEPIFQQDLQTIDMMAYNLEKAVTVASEESITDYLNHHLHPRLAKLSANPGAGDIRKYLQEYQSEDSRFYNQRRKYEQTVQMINHNLLQIFEREQLTAQQIFPHYCEHFRTDGIEHTLYAGSSVLPHRHFTQQHLSALRIWQIQALCRMYASHQQISRSLPFEMEVAILIFVYPVPITLRFKMDEKRFDVDGAYNVRFEMIKKRIDKAHVDGTNERITQPGKLTIIYPSQKEEKEYLDYLEQVRTLGLVEGNIEMLNVEALQDISGLKALRVGIKV